MGVALALAAFSVSAQTKLRYAHVGVANAPQTLYADEVAKLVKERTNGRVEIQVFANSQLGGVNEMVDGVRSGAIAMAHHDFGSLGRIVRNTAVFNTPFMYRDPEHAMRATDPAHRRRCARSTRSWCRRATCASSPPVPGHAAPDLQGEGAVGRRTCRARSTAACRSSCGPRC